MTDKHWIDLAKTVLEGKKIKSVRYLEQSEMEHLGWYKRCVVFVMDDNTLVFPSMDDEGNDGGALFYCNDKVSDGVLPTL